MKNRQFIVLCCLIVIGFCVLWFKLDSISNDTWSTRTFTHNIYQETWRILDTLDKMK